MHAANTFFVATAGAIQSRTSPIRTWLLGLTLDLPPHVVMILFGSTAAIAVGAEPLVLPAIVLPFALTHIATGHAISLRDEQRQALSSLVDIVELRDPYAAGQSARVAAIARLIAGRLGQTEEKADLIEGAGRVHDLGKVAVDPEVLLKIGKLTDGEWLQMMKRAFLFGVSGSASRRTTSSFSTLEGSGALWAWRSPVNLLPGDAQQTIVRSMTHVSSIASCLRRGCGQKIQCLWRRRSPRPASSRTLGRQGLP